MPRGSQSEPVEQLPESTSSDLARAKVEADELTTRIIELREAYYERDTVLASDAHQRLLRPMELPVRGQEARLLR